jgi:hypothetical protein
MTAINFPDNPQVNDTFSVGERTWKWTGLAWDVVATLEVVGPQGERGPVGPTGPQGTTGPAGIGIPSGGSTGQILTKSTSTDYDTSWQSTKAASYRHSQSNPSATWVIAHNLNFYPNATVEETTGHLIEGIITYNDTNTVTLSFSQAVSGIAYLS